MRRMSIVADFMKLTLKFKSTQIWVMMSQNDVPLSLRLTITEEVN